MAFLKDSQPAHQPFLTAPMSVLWLIGVLVLAHMVRVMLPGELSESILETYAFIPARYAGGADFAHDTLFQRIVPFLSHIFLHANATHVGVNSLWLLAFGPILARRLNTLKFFLFFLFCGVAGALTHLMVYWGSDAAVVGASGAIAGLMGGAMRVAYARFYGLRLAPVLSQRIVMFSLVWVAVNIVSGVLGIGLSDQVVLVAWVVHMGGYFAGLLAIGLFDWPPLGERALREA
jgi:membrane associated rhomboid family serine protease